jgi:hypothetical protein
VELLNVFPRKFTKTAGAEHFHLPPHVKNVLPCRHAPSHRNETHYQWTDAPGAYDFAFSAPSTPRPCTLPWSDIVALLQADIVERIDHAAVKAWGTLFSVPELKKHRRRLIFWPKAVNEAFYRAGLTPFTFDLGAPMQHLQEIFDGECAGSFDLSCAFFQHLLHPLIRPWFAFEVNGVAYAFKRLPMGFVASCDTQQAFTLSMSGTPARVAARTYIDGTRYVGTFTDVQRALHAARDACSQHNAAAEFGTPATTHEWLGVIYDYTAKTVKLNDAIVTKLATATRSVTSWSCRDMMQAFSYLLYAAPVHRRYLADFYHCMKFYSRRCRALQDESAHLDSPANVWPSILPQLTRWLTATIDNKPTRPPPRCDSAKWTLFTDSSGSGWGAVLINDTSCETRTVGGRWTLAEKLHINTKETLALANALRSFDTLLGHDAIRVFVDNTSTIATVKRTFGRSFGLNMAVKQVQLCGKNIVSIAYVASAENPADAPSRSATHVGVGDGSAWRSIGDSHPGMRYSDHGAAKAVVRGTTRDPLPSTRTPNRLVM